MTRKRRGLSMTSILVLALVGTITAIVLGAMAVFLQTYQRSLIRSVQTSARQSVAQVGKTVEDYLDDVNSLMELLERSSRLNEGLLRRYSRRAGPALGGLLGIVPQCGISGAAATLFSTGTITVGTMLAVFFATSDEMLPILLSSLTESSGITWKAIALIVLSKAAVGIVLGYLADLLFGRWFRAQKSIHSFCEREHCDCDEEEGNVFLAALRHTLKIAVMLIAVNFALNLLFHYIGVERLSGTILNRPVLGELILALFGLIPNCSVSVVVTESYLSGVLGLGGLFAGLLSNAGIGLLVLLRTNRNWKENAAVVAILYGFSVLAGIAVTLLAG